MKKDPNMGRDIENAWYKNQASPLPQNRTKKRKKKTSASNAAGTSVGGGT
jgi:hypothetical protein